MAKGNGRRPGAATIDPTTGNAQTVESKHYAHITGRKHPVPAPLVNSVRALETATGFPVVLFIQSAPGAMGTVGNYVWCKFVETLTELEEGKHVIVLLHSPGGFAEAAYRLARFFKLQCGGYTVVVPRYAKSAATLFALGADEIVLGKFAEMGPLDAQMDDLEREQRLSALEVTQSLERLNSEAMRAVDAQMVFWGIRSGKRLETLLPIATRFVADMMKPLFEKIDTVHYTKMARVLKVAQDYAERLLSERMPLDEAQTIAQVLTEAYSEHGFVIDAPELKRIGLRIEETDDDIGKAIDPLAPFLHSIEGNWIGLLREMNNEQDQRKETSAEASDGG